MSFIDKVLALLTLLLFLAPIGIGQLDFLNDGPIVKEIEEVYSGGRGGAVERSYALLEDIQQPLPESIKIGENCRKAITVKDILWGSSQLSYTLQGIDRYPSTDSELAYVSQEVN